MKSFWLVTIAVVISLTVAGCKGEKQSESISSPLTEIEVTTVRVKEVPIASPVELLGTVQSSHKAEIAANITGTISKLPVVLGSQVKKGDLLVEINAAEIGARLKKTQAELHQARRDLAREKTLLNKKAATAESVESLENSLMIAEAAYQEASILLSYTQVLAPFSGKITKKNSNVGDLATVGKPLLYLEDESALQIATEVPEEMIIQLQKGDRLPVSVPSANLEFEGIVSELAPTMNPTTRTGLVKLDIDAHIDLRSGMFARVSLIKNGENTLAIPIKAISSSGQMETIYIVRDQKAWLRLVRSGVEMGDWVEILSGVQADEEVVLTSLTKLSDGQPIKHQ